MKGHIQQRGKNSWRLKFDAGRDEKTGRRKTQFHTFRGTKRQAQVKLAELIASVAQDKYVEPSKITVGDFVTDRVDQWEARGDITARTAARYRELIENQIVPHIGVKHLQKLRTLDIEEWHAALRNGGRADGKGGLAPRTIGHAHRVLDKAFREAVKNELVVKNVVVNQSAPKVASDEEMVIVRDIPAFIEALRGHRLYVPAMIGLFTGMRIGEVLALNWSRLDLNRKVIEVRSALEQTKAHGIRIKAPKTKAGRRDITLPDVLVTALREFRTKQMELWFKLGGGRIPNDALLFANVDGSLPSQKAYSKAWSEFAAKIDMPDLTFHCLRHSHASQLIDAGVDIVTISKRLGHASPTVTLEVYAHMFKNDDSKAAAAINAALSR
ncbi:MAG TPA: tyrosine-type recombinase/integrase [Bradyrhizobium sp.]|jgi:integrase|uniref:tyrosine-type recombinase/integrase n=1 Tax=Bradyrhizobium sp. TaxID=376 RepID=UPI002C5E3696|nr:tyrosine-type recombinase/integrase [Bradyrhizobium sp.]HXB79656.1 tyrosine-type recombinase/integrase [Bradyrhizobium sp.]